jgi:nucleotide-binding universal stress UspA family protein
MKAQLILAATDFSPAGQSAVEVASRLARQCGATLIVLHVVQQQPAAALGPAYYGIADPDIKKIAQQLVQSQRAAPDLAVEHCIRADEPGEAIVALASERSVDLIVLGTRGQSLLTEILLGSVARHVLSHASCPVMVCHHADRRNPG